MIIKPPDDPSALLVRLEALAAGTAPASKRAAAELKNRRAGLRAENQAQFLIDDQLRNSKNWVVIHDLRLEHEGRVAQIDHLLLGRSMVGYVLETKSFHQGLKINENGEFLRWNGFHKKYEGMASPLVQNERHISILRQVIDTLNLPTRLGLTLRPDLKSLVLVSNNAQIIREKGFDSSRVVKMDQLFDAMNSDMDKEGTLSTFRSVARIVALETIAGVARQLAARHVPLRAEALVGAESPAVQVAEKQGARASGKPPVSPTTTSTPVARPVSALPADAQAQCKACAGTNGSILHGKFGYYFRCGGCQTNTPMRFTCQPGHSPRLRKAGKQFFRDCAECGSSQIFHTNQ